MHHKMSYEAVSKMIDMPIVYGGYKVYFITADNGCICSDCAKEEKELILDAIKEQNDKQWEVIAVDINYENDSIYCDHCNQQIEPEYQD